MPSQMKVHWFLPTGGDSRELAPSRPTDHQRGPDHDHLLQVALAADRLGFEGMLTPTGSYCEDAWIATASLLGRTERVKFLVAFRPGFLSPTLAAQMASTYQRMSGGRLLLNVVTGAEPAELARFGEWADKETRYERAGEFMHILRRSWLPEPFSFEGRHYHVEGATTREVPDPQPTIYFGGASPAAERVAAEHVDVYLAWGEPPDMVAERINRVGALAAGHDRQLQFGIRFHVIARPTADEAWAVAERLIAGLDPEQVAAAQADFSSAQSVGQQRMAALHGGDTGQLEIYPNVWAGPGLVRGGAGTALVGSYEDVADRMAEYQDLGFSEFILSGYPHLEEAHWFGEGVMPLLASRGMLEETSSVPGHGTARMATFR